MGAQELETIRQKILGDIVPLVIDDTASGADKFSLILRVIQSGNGNDSLYQRAYDSALAIEDSSERLDALLSLLDELEIELDQPLPGGETQSAPQEVSSQPGEPAHDSPQQPESNQ